MTGGVAVVLGRTGRNFAAGMSGGVAYVYDADGAFERRCNTDGVLIEPTAGDDRMQLKELLRKHAAYTGSDVASRLLEEWNESLRRFVTVVPKEYREILRRTKQVEDGQADRVS
jgi:glutamate synthase domain-containing protein 3